MSEHAPQVNRQQSRAAQTGLPSYEAALEQVGAGSLVAAEISADYEQYVDGHDPGSGVELQSWQDYFVESLDVRRAYGYLDGDPAPRQVRHLDSGANSGIAGDVTRAPRTGRGGGDGRPAGPPPLSRPARRRAR